MGARPSSFSKGGGYLNEVDAVWADYNFVIGDAVTIKRGKRKGEEMTPLALEVTFQVDGAEKASTKNLLIGDAGKDQPYNGVTISKDGKTLYTPDGQTIWANSEAGTFIGSLCQPEGGGDGFPEERFSEEETEINFEPALGTRLRLVSPVDEKQLKDRGMQKGKDGKEYKPRLSPRVHTVYDLPTAQRKPNGQTATPTSAKASKQAKLEVDVNEVASAKLASYVTGAKGHRLSKSKARMKALTDPEFENNDDLRDQVATLIQNDKFLSTQDGIEYDKASGTLSVSA